MDSGLGVSDPTAGDFQHNAYPRQERESDGNIITVLYADICACNQGQRGIVELGDRGSTALDQVTIPPIGYVRQRSLQLQVGSVYVSKAREGLEGHFVIFRVDSHLGDSRNDLLSVPLGAQARATPGQPRRSDVWVPVTSSQEPSWPARRLWPWVTPSTTRPRGAYALYTAPGIPVRRTSLVKTDGIRVPPGPIGELFSAILRELPVPDGHARLIGGVLLGTDLRGRRQQRRCAGLAICSLLPTA